LFYPYQYLLAALGGMVLLYGLHRRAAWMLRLDPIEVANLAFIAWAMFTVFWCWDPMWYMRGVRRHLTGLASFAIAYRVGRLMERSQFELGLIAGAFTLAAAALYRRISMGISIEEAAFRRTETTDLGWGTANYIATLLLLLTPLVLSIALNSRQRWLRVFAWPTVALVGVVQIVIASRAATVLFVIGTLLQVFGFRSRRHAVTLIATTVGMIALFVSPLGQSFILRFTSLRELGSMSVRIWYFREAWQRILHHFPWGMGLGQGVVYPDRLYGNDPHNYWLNIASELGLAGVVGWVVVLVLIWKRLSQIAADPEWRHVGRALQVSFWLGQLHTLVEPTFQGPQYQFVFFWIMGGYLGLYACRARPMVTESAVPQSYRPAPLLPAHSSSRR
jgi:O-antigen ligase